MISNDIKIRSNILIIDDEPVNIRCISTILNEKYTSMAATSGLEAIKQARSSENRPELILLDIMMPDMDGFEVCRQLKNDKLTANIPVIFITALNHEVSEIKALNLGAVDFITKPIQPNVLIARVDAHLNLKHRCDELKAIITQRTNQLFHLDRLAMLGRVSAVTNHEIQNYLGHIIGSNDIVKSKFYKLLPFMVESIKTQTLNRKQHETSLKKMEQFISLISDTGNRIDSVINNSKALINGVNDENTLFSLTASLKDALKFCHGTLKNRIQVFEDLDQGLPDCFGNAIQLEQVFINLIKNAADAMESTTNRELKVSTSYNHQKVQVSIKDNGPGIPEAIIKTIWDPFFTTKENNRGTGLGLWISKEIIEIHKGKIQVKNQQQNGANFMIELPIALSG
jgi:two-component system, NtrC family, sensor kinase